jgi:hypothetical protein
MGEVGLSRWKSNRSMGKFGVGMYEGGLVIVDIDVRGSTIGDGS